MGRASRVSGGKDFAINRESVFNDGGQRKFADNDCASLARWIRTECAPRLPQLDRIDLYETRGCGAILSWAEEGPALPI